jgi:hypothetical protein
MQQPPNTAHLFLEYARDHNMDVYTSDDAMEREASRVSVIRTPGRFSFMEIPTEIRVKVSIVLRSCNSLPSLA